jgi:DUF438 domain-containing protein
LSAANIELRRLNKLADQAASELNKLEAEKIVLESKIEAATNNIAEAREDFAYLTGGFDFKDIVNNGLPVSFADIKSEKWTSSTDSTTGKKITAEENAEQNNGWYCKRGDGEDYSLELSISEDK